jgi:hypothetical protein
MSLPYSLILTRSLFAEQAAPQFMHLKRNSRCTTIDAKKIGNKFREKKSQ